jgi:hypothetical protein
LTDPNTPAHFDTLLVRRLALVIIKIIRSFNEHQHRADIATNTPTAAMLPLYATLGLNKIKPIFILNFIIDKKLLLYLIVTFFLATIIGTISHECGHYFAAKLMGFNARFNYGMTWLEVNGKGMNTRQEFWFIFAGPLQTMITGTLGFLFLYASSRPTISLSLKQWILIFFSLFWLRQSANFVIWVANYFFTGEFGGRGDEINLSKLLHLPFWSIPLVTALAGFIVLAIILLRFIPRPQRFTFISSGLIGGISGYAFWLVYFGQKIMP